MCLPANVDFIQGDRLVLQSTVNATFLSKVVKTTLSDISAILGTCIMPTLEEQKEYINSMREGQKNEILADLDGMTLEERELHLEMKKLGLVQHKKKKEEQTDENEDRNNDGSKDTEYEEEGKKEHDKYAKEDNDDDTDTTD
jgi:hypothetical protein